VAPRFDVNAPDLYIPAMGFITYILVAGLALGTQNRYARTTQFFCRSGDFFKFFFWKRLPNLRLCKVFSFHYLALDVFVGVSVLKVLSLFLRKASAK